MNRTLILAAMLAGFAGPALAQAPAPTNVATQAAPRSLADLDSHIRQLHAQLGITAAELPQWDQFAQVMRDNAQRMSAAFADRAAAIKTMDAPADMDSYAKLASVHADNMAKLTSAFKALYDTFPPAQKQVADKVFRSRQHA